jgi:hypothetical protein
MALRRIAALVVVWCALAAHGPLASRLPEAAVRAFDRVSEDDLRRYVETLAGDELRGRGIGDAGNRAAEEFACATLTKGGVQPAGAGGSCYQPVTIDRKLPGIHTPLIIRNVLGIVEGRDPAHRD